MNIEALLNTLQSEIMNIPVEKDHHEFLDAAAMLNYKYGHRDARHAAAELVMEFARKLEGGLK